VIVFHNLNSLFQESVSSLPQTIQETKLIAGNKLFLLQVWSLATACQHGR